MPRKKSTRTALHPKVEPIPANAKVCENCGHINTFKRVKCEQCYALLPEGNYERSKRLREQSLRRRQQQSTLSASLFGETLLMTDESAASDDSDVRAKAGKEPTVDFETESGTNGDADVPDDDGEATTGSDDIELSDEDDES